MSVAAAESRTRSEPPASQQIIDKTLWNVEQAERRGVEWDFYTIGYSQKSLRQFIDVLQRRKVETLVDIRYNAVSRYKPDFTGGKLSAALRREGINYTWLRPLGIPATIREEVAGDGDLDALWTWYDIHITPRVFPMLHDGTRLSVAHAAFMCVEQDPLLCHRHRLALHLARVGLIGADL